MSSCPEPERIALDFLRGQENPFDSLARPQRLDDRFVDLHVPELLAGDRNLLLQVIDRYRVAEYSGTKDLPHTRVVTVLGDRGTGKTHLLQSLSYREDGKSQILVRPSYFDANLPFEEYLLGQLVGTLAAEDEVYHTRPIEDIAAALTRRLCRQTLRSLGPTERLFAMPGTRWRRFRFLLGGTDRQSRFFEHLAELLEDGTPSHELPHLLVRHGLSPERCCRLIHGHLRRYELGQDLLAVLRRKLYSAMVRSALLGESDPLMRLLEGEHTQIAGPASTRFEIVSRLLHTVTEICALVRQPIVFAFDNLERLFSPHNRFDGELVRGFFNSLAQGVDNTKGLLIMLFAESGLFEQAAGYMDEFARARLEQGVPLYGMGPVSVIRLNPPSVDEVKLLVKNRVRGLLAKGLETLPASDSFPFDARTVEEMVTGYQSLRNTLRRLRDQYSQIVYKQPAPREKKEVVNWENLVESRWRDQVAAAGRRLNGALTGQLQSFHAGLGSMLGQVCPLALDAWTLTDVQTAATIGDNPTYGMVSLLSWQRHQSRDTDRASLKVGVGFLLARGAGMPVDLRSKFDFFGRPPKGDRLIILWPAATDREDLVELLPAATRTVWDQSRQRKKIALRRLEMNDLTALMAFPEWLNAVQLATDQPVPPENLQAFVKERFQALIQLVAPPVLREESLVLDEN